MTRRVIFALLFAAALAMLCVAAMTCPRAHADSTACPYPFVGESVEVDVAVQVTAGYCDGPTEINGTHWHCPRALVTAGGNGFGFAPFQGVTIGGVGSGSVGGGYGKCGWKCPDNTDSVQPNPPGAWKDYLTVQGANNSCVGHMAPAGPTSTPVEADQGRPGFTPPNQLPPLVAPSPPEPPEPTMPPNEPLPTVTNPGQGNPDAAP